MRYIKYIFFLLSVCIIVLFLVFKLYIRGYNEYYSFDNEHMNEIIDGKSYYDILFIGSSRAMHHFNPRIVDSLTGLSSYNAGIDGANLLEINMTLECYLKSHPAPKIIFADIAINSFAIKKLPFFNPNNYYQFLDKPLVFEALRPYEKVYLFKYLPFLQLTQSNDLLKQNAILGYAGRTDPLTNINYKGFVDYGTDTLVLPLKKQYFMNYEIDQQGIDIFHKMINTCKEKNIKLIFIYAPEYHPEEDTYNPDFFPTIKSVSKAADVPFLDFRNNKVFENHKLFINEHHLNHYGVKIYSAMIAEEVKNALNR